MKDKSEKVVIIIRLILSSLLLWQIWINTHWSVALSLTLIMISAEIASYIATKKLAEIKKVHLENTIKKVLNK